MTDGQAHSGSPFRQALEHPSGLCRRYSVAGLQPHSVARDHLDFVLERGQAIWREEVSLRVIRDLYRRSEKPVMVSFDLDAVGQSEAPGVSAPAPSGLGAGLWFAAAFEAGRSSIVSPANVVELSPRLDVGDQTARLAALTVWWLLRGRAGEG